MGFTELPLRPNTACIYAVFEKQNWHGTILNRNLWIGWISWKFAIYALLQWCCNYIHRIVLSFLTDWIIIKMKDSFCKYTLLKTKCNAGVSNLSDFCSLLLLTFIQKRADFSRISFYKIQHTVIVYSSPVTRGLKTTV
jgi:hypothetical protein